MGRGILHIITGEGKGKTTSSVGYCLRAAAQGRRVLFAQFMKRVKGGETLFLEELSIKVMRFSEVLSPLFNPGLDPDENRAGAIKALEALKGAMGQYDLIVLDEFIHLVGSNIITEDEAMGFLGSRPKGLDVIITGRGATARMMDAATVVTEMKSIKHPADEGLGAREGIEY